MDYLFPVDELASLLDLVESYLEIIVPSIESVICELLALRKDNNASKSINLSLNSLIDDHIAKFVLCTLDRNTNTLAHTSKCNARVVSLDDSDVVLNKLAYQLDHMILRVQSSFLKWLEHSHVCSDCLFFQWGEFVRQELFDKFAKQLFFLKFPWVH